MFCRKCGAQNPKNARRCIECGADLHKGYDQPIEGAPKRRKTIVSFLINLLCCAVIVGMIAVAAGYACLIEFPRLPTSKYPAFLVNGWSTLRVIQDRRCTFEQTAEIPVTGLPEAVVNEEADEESMCTNPAILFEPEGGGIGTEFAIFLNNFSPDDEIEACWYYPDGTVINCADLDADSKGNRITKFWSENDDVPGVYTMEAIGECSSAKAMFEILPNVDSDKE